MYVRKKYNNFKSNLKFTSLGIDQLRSSSAGENTSKLSIEQRNDRKIKSDR